VLNPGAGWPNKRWCPERFGALARHLRDRHGLLSVVMWGPGEQLLADTVVSASNGAARCAPATGLGDLIAVIKRAALFVAGDTGPLQIAAALGTPIVSMFGPTNPARNGPWSALDISLSRFDQCDCHYKRRCRRPSRCIDDITLDEVLAAVDRRLGASDTQG
jgi:heptosyltransferase-1